MHSTIGAAVRILDESRFADRPARSDEGRHRVSGRHRGSAGKLGIGRWAGPSQGGLDMTAPAGIEIEPRAEPIGNTFHLRELRYPLTVEEIAFAGRRTRDSCAGAGCACARTGIGLRPTARCHHNRNCRALPFMMSATKESQDVHRHTFPCCQSRFWREPRSMVGHFTNTRPSGRMEMRWVPTTWYPGGRPSPTAGAALL